MTTASFLTLAGSRFGEPAGRDLWQRSTLAAAAGFTGIGAVPSDAVAWSPDLPCPVTELEWLDLAAPCWGDLDRLLAMGGSRVNAGVCGPLPCDGAMMRTLRSLADAVSPLTVAVEPVAFGSLWSVTACLDLIRAAGRQNVGLLWDCWQVRAHGEILPSLASMAPLTAEVQLAGPGPDAMTRGLPDLWALSSLAGLRCHGFSGPASVEVTSPRLRDASDQVLVSALGRCAL
jgi:hypothetical protein